MKKIWEQFKSRKDKNGYYQFYLGRKNVTAEWMNFFSSLPPEKEKIAVWLFLKKFSPKQNIKRIT